MHDLVFLICFLPALISCCWCDIIHATCKCMISLWKNFVFGQVNDINVINIVYNGGKVMNQATILYYYITFS